MLRKALLAVQLFIQLTGVLSFSVLVGWTKELLGVDFELA